MASRTITDLIEGFLYIGFSFLQNQAEAIILLISI